MSKNLKKLAIVALVTLAAASIVFAKSGKNSERAWLGVYTQSVDYEMAEAFDLGVNYGAIVNKIYEDSPAEKSGIKESDVIISIDGTKITDSDDLLDVVASYKKDDEIKLVVMRDDSEVKLKIKLGSRSDYEVDNNKWFGKNRSGRLWGNASPVPPIPKIPSIGHLSSPGNFMFFSNHSQIGVSISSLSDQLGEYFGVKNGEGVLITEVHQDSPAEKAGLKAGDVVIEIDGEQVETLSDLQDAIREKDEGDKAEIVFLRNKKEKTLSVEIEEVEGNFSSHSYSFFNGDDDSHERVFIWKGDDGVVWDQEEFDNEMKKFKIEMRGFNSEMKNSNRNELREIQRELKKEMEELKRELKKIKKKLN